MDLIDTIDINRICILKSDTKKGALLELIELISKMNLVEEPEALKEKIFYRESLMSTGIGLGIGVPHVRMEGIEKPFITIGISPKGIKDYEAIDGKLVKVIVMIVAGASQHKDYIKLLSQIVTILKHKDIIGEKFTKAKNPKEIYDIICEEAKNAWASFR